MLSPPLLIVRIQFPKRLQKESCMIPKGQAPGSLSRYSVPHPCMARLRGVSCDDSDLRAPHEDIWQTKPLVPEKSYCHKLSNPLDLHWRGRASTRQKSPWKGCPKKRVLQMRYSYIWPIPALVMYHQ